MKKEEIYASLEFVSDAYLESAADAMIGKGKRRGTFWKQMSVAAACLVLVTAVVVTIPLGRSDHSENVTTSGSNINGILTNDTGPHSYITSSHVTTDDPNCIPPQVPMEADEVEQWMADHLLLNDKIDPNGYIASANVRFLLDNGMSNLFDNIIGKADEDSDDGMAGAEVGMMTFEGSNVALYWSMTEPVKLGSYVIYSGKNGVYNSGEYSFVSFVNPVGWKLYGSNEPIDVNDIDPDTFQSASAPADKKSIELAGYHLLDDVFEGDMGYTVCTPYGYKIASDKQAEYQYYCLFIEYGADVQEITQIAELKLYAAD